MGSVHTPALLFCFPHHVDLSREFITVSNKYNRNDYVMLYRVWSNLERWKYSNSRHQEISRSRKLLRRQMHLGQAKMDRNISLFSFWRFECNWYAYALFILWGNLPGMYIYIEPAGQHRITSVFCFEASEHWRIAVLSVVPLCLRLTCVVLCQQLGCGLRFRRKEKAVRLYIWRMWWVDQFHFGSDGFVSWLARRYAPSVSSSLSSLALS